MYISMYISMPSITVFCAKNHTDLLDNRHLDIRLLHILPNHHESIEPVLRIELPRCIHSRRQPYTEQFASSSLATKLCTLLERHYRRCSRVESNRCRSADRRLHIGSCMAAAIK